MESRRSHLGDLRWPELADGVRRILAVPVGSCEQHGAHLPLDTDTRIAIAVAHRLADARDDVVVAPPLTITASGEHAGFPGTLSVGTDVTAALVVELVRSADWARGVLLVNGHGGNRDAVERAVAVGTAEGRTVVAFWPHVEGGDLHAGCTETSIMLHLDPDAVDLAAATAGPSPTIAELRRAGVRAVSPGGVLGDPSHASAADGIRILAALTEQIVRRAAAEWPP